MVKTRLNRLFMLAIAAILALLLPFAAGVAQASFNAPPAPGAPGGEVPVDEVADFLKNPSEYVYLVVELTDEPATQVYARERVTRTESEAVSATRAQLQRIKQSQDRFINTLLSRGILKNVKPAVGDAEFVVYQTQRVYNGVALRVKAEKIPQIAQLPGVKAIHRLNLKTLDNSYSVPLISAPQVWTLGLGNTGNGIKVGIIDTGIDYLHTNFGGPGTGYDANNTTIVGDAPNYPGAKVIGGYDFVGDDYDASGESGSPVPQPDPDPMDCNGHGSHVAGTVAGYGVLQDGSTYGGPYGPGAYTTANFYIGPGVAPQAQLVALRVFGCEGSTAVTDLAIEWAVDPNGDGDFSDHLDVINMSLGAGYGSEYDTSAIASNNAALAGVIVVASAGNSYDTYYITGSPAVATRAISVASSIDAQDIMDAFEVTAAPAGFESLIGWHGSYHSANYNWAAMSSPVTGILKLPPSNNTGGCASFPSGYFTNTIALLDWTFLADGETNQCGSVARVGNAYAAGAKGVILVYTKPYLDILIAGTSTIPATITTQSVGNALKAAMQAGDVTVSLSNERMGTFIANDPTLNDLVSRFSSRGPRRTDSLLKPDITAPGQTIFSTAALTGNQGVSFNGTSMAAPHISGVMALLRQLRPGWSVEELKALVMNTANHDLFTAAGQTGNKYGPARVGAGRVDVEQAARSFVVLYNANDEGAVSVSFGNIEVVGTYTAEKVVKVVNKHASKTLNYNVALDQRVSIPGVTFALLNPDNTPLTTLSLGPGQQKTFKVRLTADASQMTHTRDVTVNATQAGLPRHWISEAAALITLTPSGGGTQPALRLPVHAVARPASAMSATPSQITINKANPASTVEVTLQGSGLADYPSLVSAFELLGMDTDETPVPTSLKHADLKYIGAMSDYPLSGIDTATSLYFAIATQADWSTPNEVEFDIYIDVDQDGTADFAVYNTSVAYNSNPSDVFLSRLLNLNTGTGYSYLLNGLFANEADTAPFNSNLVILPIAAYRLNDTDGKFDFYIETYSRDREDENPVDVSEVYTYDWRHPALLTINTTAGNEFEGLPFYKDVPQTLTFSYDLAHAETTGLKGILLLHHHNATQTAQVITLESKWLNFLPLISK